MVGLWRVMKWAWKYTAYIQNKHLFICLVVVGQVKYDKSKFIAMAIVLLVWKLQQTVKFKVFKNGPKEIEPKKYKWAHIFPP